jgi:hypothetical protein
MTAFEQYLDSEILECERLVLEAEENAEKVRIFRNYDAQLTNSQQPFEPESGE